MGYGLNGPHYWQSDCSLRSGFWNPPCGLYLATPWETEETLAANGNCRFRHNNLKRDSIIRWLISRGEFSGDNTWIHSTDFSTVKLIQRGHFPGSFNVFLLSMCKVFWDQGDIFLGWISGHCIWNFRIVKYCYKDKPK